MHDDKRDKTAMESGERERRYDEAARRGARYHGDKSYHARPSDRDTTRSGYSRDYSESDAVSRSRWDDSQSRSSRENPKESSSKSSHKRLRAWTPSEDEETGRRMRKLDDKPDRRDSYPHKSERTKPDGRSKDENVHRSHDDNYSIRFGERPEEQDSERDNHRRRERESTREKKDGDHSVAGSSRTEHSESRGRSATRQYSRSQTSSWSSSSSSSSTTRSSADEKRRTSKRRHRDDTSHSPSRSRQSHGRGHRSPHSKRKHRSSSRDKDRKKRRHREKRHNEERRSVLTGKKIKLKVKKGREDHERDANRQDLLQFLNSTL